MKSRRDFLKSVGALGISGTGTLVLAEEPAALPKTPKPASDDRSYWLDVLDRLATPVLTHLSRHELKKVMPVEATDPRDRAQYTHLEALGRLISGIAPWLDAKGLNEAESKRRNEFVGLAQASLAAATDPQSPDFMNFTRGGQPLVDAAFLAQGILRAPNVLWNSLDSRTRLQVIQALKSTRTIGTPHGSNWVMFAAMIETALHFMGESTIKERLEDCVDAMLHWYKGDGMYGDGEYFHFDYYNSFVIHPMLLGTLDVLRRKDKMYEAIFLKALHRSQRYAAIQERLIAPDGTFPSVGRSTTYRFGAFHSLAQIALMEKLPAPLKPAQVRNALTTVMRKIIEAPGTFNESGWLQIGFYGHQPALGEGYISTGSLYLCATALLPLGLSPANEFWNSPPSPWTSCQIWSGANLAADHAMSES